MSSKLRGPRWQVVEEGIREMVTLVEHASPHLHKAALAFLQKRTAGETLTSLAAPRPKAGYKATEFAWEDRFFDPM